MESMTKLLREKIEASSIVKVGGAFDAMSAKLVEINGFDAVWAGSFGISATHALPDASILTMTEFLDVSSKMVGACKIPVIVDCDTGYGGPNNVSHMVKKYENVGVAAISIEDKTFPKQNSLLENGTQELLSEKDFVAKILAAKEAKQNNNFMIIARVESLIAGLGIEDAIKRAEAYEKAGADAIIIHSKKKTAEEIFNFCKKWKGNIPLVAIPTTYTSVTLTELQSNGINMVIYANQSLRAAFLAISQTLKQISNSETLDKITMPMSSMEEIFQFQDMYKIKKQETDIENELKRLGYMD